MNDEILAECLAHPDDDAPRMVWADAVGGERGELVGLQCGRAGLPAAALAARNRRERALVEAHAMAWSGLAGLARRVRFRRGFVDAIEVDAATWLAHGERIVELAPFVTSLALANVPHDARTQDEAHARLEAVVTHPAFVRIRGLDLVGDEPRGYPWAETVARVLATTGTMARLVALGMPGDHTPDTSILLASGGPERLERLWLRRSASAGEWLRIMLRASPRLAAIDARAAELPLDTLAEEAPHLVELGLRHDRFGGLLRLARTALAERLERLTLMLEGRLHSSAADVATTLVQFPRLRALELGDHCPDDIMEALGRVELPALRELRLAWTPNEAALDRIVRHLGPQLELLDLRQAVRIPPRPLPGDVLVHEPGRPELLHVHATEPASWHIQPAIGDQGVPVAPCWLVAETGPMAGRVWDLSPHGDRPIRIGRSQTSDVWLLEDSVARVHAILEWTRDGHRVRDMGSTNGVVIAGTRIDTPVELGSDTRFVLGRAFLRYLRGPGAGERATVRARDLLDFEPITGLRRRTPPDAARVRIANTTELVRHYGWIAVDVAFAEVARRLRAAARGQELALTTPAYAEFGVHPAAAAATLVAGCDNPVAFEGEDIAIALQIASPA